MTRTFHSPWHRKFACACLACAVALACLAAEAAGAAPAARGLVQQVPQPQSPRTQSPGTQNPGTQNPNPRAGKESDQKVPREIRVMPRPQALAIARGDTGIQVDGVLLDWPEHVPVVLLDDFRQLSGTGDQAWSGVADLSARGFFLWDEEDLYFALVVRDDWHRPILGRGSAREIPPADAVVLSFDAGRDTRSMGPDLNRADDCEYWLGDMEQAERKAILWDRYRGTVRFSEGGALKVKRDEEAKITTYEARMPWSEILPPGGKPSVNMVTDLKITINDFDDIADPMVQTRVGWTFGTGASIDPGLFGALMLVDKVDRELGRMPTMPERPETATKVPGPVAQGELVSKLSRTVPVSFTSEKGIPQTMGGSQRQKALEALDDQLERMPRLDYLLFNQLLDRRMAREVAGYCESGAPAFWRMMLTEVLKGVREDPPEAGYRLFRLPQGGWFVRSTAGNFAIDPVGPDVATRLGPGCDFVLFTQPLNDTKRDDQLMVRMVSLKVPKPLFIHSRVGLPGVPAESLQPVDVDQRYQVGALVVHTIGSSVSEGQVPASLSYLVTWPDGTTLVVGSPQLEEERVMSAGLGVSPDSPPDCLILSAYHPYLKAVGMRVQAGITVIDDIFRVGDVPGARGRVSLEDAWRMQQDLGARETLLLAPGDSWTISPE